MSESRIGQKRSLETRKKMSEAQKGSKGSNWQGGKTEIARSIRNSSEYKQWRKAVYERDNYTCQWPGCGKRGGKLNADHIKSFKDYPELRFVLENGRTLCIECHKKTETYGWKVKNNKKTVDKVQLDKLEA